ADRKRAQHDGEDTGETAHADDRDWNGAGAGGRCAVAVNQRSGSHPCPIAQRIGPREMQRLECFGGGLLEGTPKLLKSKVVRRDSIFRYGEVNCPETR